MKEAGFRFEVIKPDVEEDFPADMPAEDVPVFLASKKTAFFKLSGGQVVLTADTVVIVDGAILNKPTDREDAIRMLSLLQGRSHQVITGVSIVSSHEKNTFREETEVVFKPLTLQEIEYYVDHFNPFDKAGSYGAQDCLPSGMNPCSPDEIAFLEKIGKPELVTNTFTRAPGSRGIAAIAEIKGSYFNVMGLPVHRVYYSLDRYTLDRA